MDLTKSPQGSVRRAARNISHPMLRRSTKGPLDNADDPLSGGPSDQQTTAAVESTSHEAEDRAILPAIPIADQANVIPLPPSLRFLQNPVLYHRIPTDTVPEAYLRSASQPPAGTPLRELLQYGHFRRAAETALQELLNPQTQDAEKVLQLLYCRLACLTLITRPDIAADEALPLLDFLTSNTIGVTEAQKLVPWPLRILIIRLQSIGAEDGGRRAIMTLYNLASETRARLQDAQRLKHEDDIRVWSDRLLDIGLRVADTLVEMGELETARRHLESLTATETDELCFRKVLLSIRLGDLESAQRFTENLNGEQKRAIGGALIRVSKSKNSEAAETWRAGATEIENDQIKIQNEAIYLLYAGRIVEAMQLLESLAQSSPAFHTMLFNLSTLYELTDENAVDRKLGMIKKLASSQPASSAMNWERNEHDFKL